MLLKKSEHDRAIGLRKQGKTYREILTEIPVAKSTLSLWLKSVGLSKEQKQRITQKRLDAAIRGGIAKKLQRLEREKSIKAMARISDSNN